MTTHHHHHEVTVEEFDGIDPKIYHRRWAILATMCLSLVLIVATVSSVNVAIPSLAGSELKPTNTQILWIVDAYTLVFAALLLPTAAGRSLRPQGRAADRPRDLRRRVPGRACPRS